MGQYWLAARPQDHEGIIAKMGAGLVADDRLQSDPANPHLRVVVCVEAKAERYASRWEGSGNQ